MDITLTTTLTATTLETSATRVRWIQDGEKEILFVDLSNVLPDESLAALAECEQILKGRAEGSVLVLIDVTNAVYNPSISARWKAARISLAPIIRGSAVYGFSGMVGVALRGFADGLRLLGLNRIGEEFRFFKSRTEALAWLKQF